MKKFFVLALLSFFTGCGGASDTEPPVKVEYQSFNGGSVLEAFPHPVKNDNKAKTKIFFILSPSFVKIYKIIDYQYLNYSLNIILVHIIS